MDLQADFSNISAARRIELKANSHLMLPELKTLFDNHIFFFNNSSWVKNYKFKRVY